VPQLNKTILFKDLYHLSFYLLAFTLPFSIQLNSFFIILLFVLSFYKRELYKNLKGINQRLFILLTSFYLIQVVGLLYSENIQSGLFHLEVKLGFLAFPLIFLNAPVKHAYIRNMQLVFVTSVLLSCLFTSLGIFYVNKMQGFEFNSTNQWYYSYTNLGNILRFHPIYFSLYVSFSILILFYYFKNFSSFYKTISIVIFLFLTMFLLQLSARMQVFALTLIFLGVIFYWFLKRKKILLALASTTMFFLGLIFFINQFPILKERLLGTFKLGGNEITDKWNMDARLIKWKCGAEIIRNNFALGVGTGDAQIELQKCYVSINSEEHIINKYNAHNQYIQTFIANGIVGFLILIGILIAGLFISYKFKSFLFFSFLFLFIFACFTESTLSVQKGVVFFSFYSSVFAFSFYNLKE